LRKRLERDEEEMRRERKEERREEKVQLHMKTYEDMG
jgi:hypothetical protein